MSVDQVTGALVITERVPKGLRLRLTEQGKSELREYVMPSSLAYLDGRTSDARLSEITFTKSHADILSALLEDLEECGDLHLLADYEYELLGALTSAPIIVTRPQFNRADEAMPLTGFDAAFWFERYQVESELETLLRTGEVTFDLASEPQDLLACECGLQTYDLEKMHAHNCDGKKATK